MNEQEKLTFSSNDFKGLYLNSEVGLVFAVQTCNCCQTCKN